MKTIICLILAISIYSEAHAFSFPGFGMFGNDQHIGAELFSNQNFDSGGIWALTGVAISGGTLNFSSAASGSNALQAVTTIGKKYRVTFNVVSISAGTIAIRSAPGSVYSGTTLPGIISAVVVADSVTIGIRAIGTTTAVIDNASCREIK